MVRMDVEGSVEVTGVVLAGGASRRMGRDKAALVLEGETLLARVIRRLESATREVVVVGSPERTQLAPGARVVPDARPGLGPLGGIYSGLLASTTPYAFVVACDMPFLNPALVWYLLGLAEGYDAVVPRTTRGTEQLHAVYGRTCLPALAARLDAGELAVVGLYDSIRVRVVEPAEWAPYDPDGRSMLNVNTPAEWEHVRTLGAH
jgi:molybdopterin-guanine dinucleotide biosynthesis protein A